MGVPIRKTAASTRSRRSHLPHNQRLEQTSSPIASPRASRHSPRSSRASSPNSTSSEPAAVDIADHQSTEGSCRSPTPTPAPQTPTRITSVSPSSVANSQDPVDTHSGVDAVEQLSNGVFQSSPVPSISSSTGVHSSESPIPPVATSFPSIGSPRSSLPPLNATILQSIFSPRSPLPPISFSADVSSLESPTPAVDASISRSIGNPQSSPAPSILSTPAVNSSKSTSQAANVSKKFDLRGKIIPHCSARRMYLEYRKTRRRTPTVFGSYDEAMSSEESEGRLFFWGDDGGLRAVFKRLPEHLTNNSQSQMTSPSTLGRKRKAEDSETELIALNGANQRVVLPNQEGQRLEETFPEAMAQQEAPAQQETPQPVEHAGAARQGEVQVRNRGLLDRMGEHISTVYNAVGPARITNGIRHAYNRVARTLTRRPAPQSPQYEAIETRRTTTTGLVVKRLKRLPDPVRYHGPDGYNTLRPDRISTLKRFEWTDDVTKHVGCDHLNNVVKLFENIVSVLHDWLLIGYTDGHEQCILRVDQIPPQQRGGNTPVMPISIAFHNYLILKHGKTSPALVSTAREQWMQLAHDGMRAVAVTYQQGTLDELKRSGAMPTERLNLFPVGYNKAYFRNCAEFLKVFIEQYEAMGLSESDAIALARVALDFDAIHKGEIPASYVEWEETVLPGTFPGGVESLLFDTIALDSLKFDYAWDYRCPGPRPDPTTPSFPFLQRFVKQNPTPSQNTKTWPRTILTTPKQSPSATIVTPNVGPTMTFRAPSPSDASSDAASPMVVDTSPPAESTEERAVEDITATATTNSTLKSQCLSPLVEEPAPVRSPGEIEVNTNLALAARVSAANINVAKPKSSDFLAPHHDTTTAKNDTDTSRIRGSPHVKFFSPLAFYKLPDNSPVREKTQANTTPFASHVTVPQATREQGAGHRSKKSAIKARTSIHASETELETLVGSQLHISDAKKGANTLKLQERKDREEAQRREAEKKRIEEARRQEEERQREEQARLALAGGLRPPQHPIIPDLTEHWETRVRQTLSARGDTKLAMSPEGTALKRKDFETVVPPTEWLNDEIVNSALKHLANSINNKAGITDIKAQTAKCIAFNSFFGKKIADGDDISARIPRRFGVRKDNLLDIDTILFPICRGNHWTVVAIRPKLRTIAHMDSLRPRGAGSPEITTKTLKWIQGFLGELFVFDDWELVDYTSPTQGNSWDCGIHAVTNGMCIALGIDPAYYKPEDLPLQRRRIAAIILNEGFRDEFELEL